MNKIKAYILPKEREPFINCDDNFSFNEEKLNFAVCDGSSSDFFSKIFSRLLSDYYSETGSDMFTPEIILDLNSQCREKVKEELDRAGCRPGSFPYVHFLRRDPGCSTLVCLSFHNDRENPTFDFYALGDSMIFFIPKGEYIPELQISSDSDEDYSFNPNINFGYTPPIASSYSTEWLTLMKKEAERPLKEGTFVMVTDALAEWLLRNVEVSPEDKFKEILEIDSQEKFESYIRDIRVKGAHMDDMTLVVISIDDVNELRFENIDKFDYRAIAQEQSHKEKHQTSNPEEDIVEEPSKESEEIICQAKNLEESDHEVQEIVDEPEESLDILREKNEDLQKENEDLQKENELLRKENDDLRKSITDEKKKNHSKTLDQKKKYNKRKGKKRS